MATDLTKLTRRLLGLSEGTLLLCDGEGREVEDYYIYNTSGYYCGAPSGNGGFYQNAHQWIWHDQREQIQEGGL